MKNFDFWRQLLLLPVGLSLALFATAIAWGYDLRLGHAFYLGGEWLGSGYWWVETILHEGAQQFVISLGSIAALALLASIWVESLRVWRRPLTYFTLNLAIATGMVAALKSISGIPCPWSLKEFGGSLPVITILDAFHGGTPGGSCFPAAHAACGYSFFSLYFLLRDTRPRLAPVGLAAALAIGLVFGITQQVRGAHLVTHDIASAAICWVVALLLYAIAFGQDVAPAPVPATRILTIVDQEVSPSPAGLTNL